MTTPGSPIKLPAQLQQGTLINARYEVRALIGAGGFATVYEAFDDLIQRPVALKLLNLALVGVAEDELARKLKRFKLEAQAAASIDHPNVVTIFDMGITDQKQPYIVMERLHGHDLAQEIDQRGALEPARALTLLCKALSALGEGHALGIVHKDLKPSNLFLTYPGTGREDIRILDFGIARLDVQDASLTGTGQVLGTPRYLAPEYIRDQIVTPALDVYQMGLILIEALAGKPAIATTNPLDCIVRHSRGEIEIEPWLQRGLLWKVLGQSLDLDHTRRFPDATAFAQALSEVDPSSLRPAPAALLGGVPALAFDMVSFSDDELSDDVEIALLDEDAPAKPPARRPLNTSPPGFFDDPELRLVALDLSVTDRSATHMTGDEGPQAAALIPSGLPTSTEFRNPGPPARPAPPRPRQGERGRRPEPAPDRSRLLLQVGLAVVGVGLVAVLFLVFGGGERQGDEAPTPAAVVDDRIAVEVVTAPPGATLIQGGRILGRSPMTLYFDKEGPEPRRVSLHHEGFYPRKLSIAASDAPQKVIGLRAIGE